MLLSTYENQDIARLGNVRKIRWDTRLLGWQSAIKPSRITPTRARLFYHSISGLLPLMVSYLVNVINFEEIASITKPLKVIIGQN